LAITLLMKCEHLTCSSLFLTSVQTVRTCHVLA